MARGHGRKVVPVEAIALAQGQTLNEYIADLATAFGIKERSAWGYIAAFKWGGLIQVVDGRISKVAKPKPPGSRTRFITEMGNRITPDNVLQRYRERDKQPDHQVFRRALTEPNAIKAFEEGRIGWCPKCKRWHFTRTAVVEQDGVVRCPWITSLHGDSTVAPELLMHPDADLEAAGLYHMPPAVDAAR
jgi:hypothetical protein